MPSCLPRMKTLRRRIVAKALQALQTEVVQPTVFGGDEGNDHKTLREAGRDMSPPIRLDVFSDYL